VTADFGQLNVNLRGGDATEHHNAPQDVVDLHDGLDDALHPLAALESVAKEVVLSVKVLSVVEGRRR